MKLNPRVCFAFGFFSCFMMLSVGAYFQFVMELEPCPLCISQRVAILLTGLVFLAAAVHNPGKTGIKIYAVLAAFFALAGAGISTRHVWLQHLPPDQVPECGPGLTYVFKHFPLSETVKLLLSGTGECADVLWTFMDLSIPGWTLVAFLGLAGLSIAQLWNVNRFRGR
ncbi:MAG: disulfide bond formation protein B [Gammaproteobacteria bacterium]